MNKTQYMIGVDIGTTSTKAVLFEESGKPVAKADAGYPLHTPTASVAEQDPEQIFRTVIHTIKQVVSNGRTSADQVMFVSFSSAMHSVIAVDADGKPLTPCITWGTTAAPNGRSG